MQFFGKEYSVKKDQLKRTLPNDLWVPFNAGRRVGVKTKSVATPGAFSSVPNPSSTNLSDWINYKIDKGDITVSGSGLANGDMGDIVLSGTPAASVWTIDNGVVSSGKIANGAVTMAKIAQAGATVNQAIVWDGTAWVPTTITGTGDYEYEATAVTPVTDAGCFITCTETGATFARTGGTSTNTEGTVTIPEYARVKGVTVHFSTSQAPGTTYFLNVDYLGTLKDVNGSTSTFRPVFATVTTKPSSINDTTPATNYVHSGTPLQVGVAGIDDNGTRVRYRIKITNYSQQVGAADSILSVIMP